MKNSVDNRTGRGSRSKPFSYTVFHWVSIVLVFAVALQGRPLIAQRHTFDPSLSLNLAHSSNIDFVGEPEEGDSSLRATVSLPLERSLKTGALSFSYTGWIEAFSNFGDLDNVGHYLSLGISTQPSRRSSVNFRVGYSKSQDQGGPVTGIIEETNDPTFNRRVEQDRLALDFDYTRQLSKKWYAGLGVRGSAWAFEDPVSDEPTNVARDRIEYGGLLRVGRDVSSTLKVGLLTTWQRFDLDLGGATDSVAAALEVTKTIDEDSSWVLGLGAFQNDPESAPGESEAETLTGWLGSFSYNHSLRKVNLNILGQHGPGSGGYRLGTAVTSYLTISVVDSFLRRWGWGIYGRAGQRDPDAELQSTVRTWEIGGGVNTSIGRFLGLSLAASYVDQSADFEGDAGRFYRVVGSLAWHPLGWKKWTSWRTF